MVMPTCLKMKRHPNIKVDVVASPAFDRVEFQLDSKTTHGTVHFVILSTY